MIVKKIFSFLLLSVLTGSFVSSQTKSGIVQYSVSQIENKTSNNSDVLDRTYQRLNDLQYVLKFDSTRSIYSLKKLLSINNDEIYVKMASSIAGRGEYYTDLRNKERIRYINFRGDEFLINYPFEKLAWNITNEVKKIKGFSCRKATLILGKSLIRTKPIDVTAWFTDDIPYGYGPKLFFGLPGLIMELEEGNLRFTVSNIDLNENVKIEPQSNGIQLSELEFNEFIIKKSKEMGFIRG
ncbi:MAG: GLPGLI family protein [Bacteroidota bacterium]